MDGIVALPSRTGIVNSRRIPGSRARQGGGLDFSDGLRYNRRELSPKRLFP